MKKKTIIYGVKVNDRIHYIGKRINAVNARGKINKSEAVYQYSNPKIRNVFTSNSDVNVVPLKVVDELEWYDEKLMEVLNMHKDNHPLLNAQWMLEGKHGFWEDKKRDAHTLQRLSESKFQKIIQYDCEGNLVKIWKSGKDAAIQVFKDYRIINGGGVSKIYRLVTNTTLKGRFKHDSYWFKEAELLKYFGLLPKKLNLVILYAEERKRRKIAIEPHCKSCGETNPENFYPNNKSRCKTCIGKKRNDRVLAGKKRKCVVWYNQDGSVKETYVNVIHAAYELKTSISTIKRLCQNTTDKNPDYILRYGEKIVQPENIEYPAYKIKRLKRPVCNKSTYVNTRTRTTIIYYDEVRILKVFDNVYDAADYFKVKTKRIRDICCSGKDGLNTLPKGTGLKYGVKKKIVL